MLIPPPVKFIASVAGIVRGHAAIRRIDVRAALETDRACQCQDTGVRHNLNFGNGCRGYIDSGQTKQRCQVCWLLLANSGLNETVAG